MAKKFVFQWHITHKCNLRCKHCYQEEYGKDLAFENLYHIFCQIKSFVREHNYKGHINFTGGEPFVSPHLWRLFDLCEGEQITFGILTNGTLLTEEIARKLATYKGLSFVQISIDGSREKHDSIRGTGNFDKAFRAIKLLRKTGISSMVSFTLSKENNDELRKVIRICERAKVDRFWTDRLIPMGSNELDILSTEEYRSCLDILSYEIRRSKRLPWIKTTIHNNRALQFLCDCGKRTSSVYECSAGKQLLTILADGTLLPCRRLPIEIGNLLMENMSTLMAESEVIAKLRQNEEPQECQNCLFHKQCKGGAKCLTYAVTGKWDRKDINCWMKN